jgi:sulfur carrier protein ThiS
MLEAYPLLGVHLYDEKRQLRKHVLVFYNDESIKRMSDLDIPLRAGDRLTIVQAVSGG